MTDILPGASVVVGIDGSKAALHATEWAIDEAIARDVPLRLICVVGLGPEAGLSPNEIELDVEYAESVLRQASAAIEATGKDVKVDTAILRGAPADVLLAESRAAELVCVGSSGIGAVARRIVGSTATTLATRASCPVAIIRYHPSDRSSYRRWIAAAVKASTDDEQILLSAMQEARLRHVPVLAIGLWQEDFGFTPYDELDRLMESWRQRFPDVRVYPVTTRSGLVQYLTEDDEPVAMVVVGADEADRVADIVGPHSHHIVGHPECSVLVVRH
jgi:nucleotide-binding universal stress UspA family protein